MTIELGQVLADLAGLTDAEYELRRRPLAKELGLRVRFLDEKRDEMLVDRPPAPSAEPTTTPEKLLDASRDVLDAEDVLAMLGAALPCLGHAGPTTAVELVYVAIVSRLLDRPLNIVLDGPSSGGKTFTVGIAARFHPPGSVHDLTACSERALVYLDADFAHTVVIIAEGSALHQDGIGATIVRSLAWGDGIKYATTMKNADGKFEGLVIEKPGPTGLITTSTKPLDAELSTRLLAVPIADDSELTREIIRMQAVDASGNAAPDVDLRTWIAASEWLAAFGERRVVVPFASELAESVPYDDVRLRRDFAQIITIIKTIAMIHQRTRERDVEGRIIATVADYEAARRLLSDVLSATVDAVPNTVRETLDAVEELAKSNPTGVTVATLAKHLGMSRQGALRRAKSALRRGYLVNTEDRPGRALCLVPGEPLPPRRVVLPPLPPGNGVVMLSAPIGRDNTTKPKPGGSGGEEDSNPPPAGSVTVSLDEGDQTWLTDTPDDPVWSEGGRDSMGDE